MTDPNFDPLAALPAGLVARRDEHRGIKTIGRLVLVCAIGLVIAAALLIATALQVMHTLDAADLATERQRAANAVDVMTARNGPLTDSDAITLGSIAGLRAAHLSYRRTTIARVEQIPLLAGQGPSGSYLTWTRSAMAETVFRQFAPIRLPIIGAMLVLVLGVMIKVRRIVGDIERQRRLAYRQSRSDVLTGLANRLAFETALAELAAGTVPFAILLFDLDRFKAINDAHGHAAGDAVLCAVGARLSRILEGDDVLARLGGDEFGMLCTGRVEQTTLTALAQSCIAAVEPPIQLQNGAVSIGISLGIVPVGGLNLLPATLMGAADTALYAAKSQSGSSFRFAGEPSGKAQPPTRLLQTA